jgi:hypothetical protein
VGGSTPTFLANKITGYTLGAVFPMAPSSSAPTTPA